MDTAVRFTMRDNDALRGALGVVRTLGAKMSFSTKENPTSLRVVLNSDWTHSSGYISLHVPKDTVMFSGNEKRMVLSTIPSESAISIYDTPEGAVEETLTVTVGRLLDVDPYAAIVHTSEWLDNLVTVLNEKELRSVGQLMFWGDKPIDATYAYHEPPF